MRRIAVMLEIRVALSGQAANSHFDIIRSIVFSCKYSAVGVHRSRCRTRKKCRPNILRSACLAHLWRLFRYFIAAASRYSQPTHVAQLTQSREQSPSETWLAASDVSANWTGGWQAPLRAAGVRTGLEPASGGQPR